MLLSLDIERIEALADGAPFGQVGAYERLIGRAKGKRFVALAGIERIVIDGDLRAVEDEHPRLARKASLDEDAA